MKKQSFSIICTTDCHFTDVLRRNIWLSTLMRSGLFSPFYFPGSSTWKAMGMDISTQCTWPKHLKRRSFNMDCMVFEPVFWRILLHSWPCPYRLFLKLFLKFTFAICGRVKCFHNNWPQVQRIKNTWGWVSANAQLPVETARHTLCSLKLFKRSIKLIGCSKFLPINTADHILNGIRWLVHF